MKQLTEPHKAVLIVASGSSTTLTAAKIHQMLSDTEHTTLNLQQLTIRLNLCCLGKVCLMYWYWRARVQLKIFKRFLIVYS